MQNTYECMMYAFVPAKIYTKGDMLFQQALQKMKKKKKKEKQHNPEQSTAVCDV